MRLHACGRGRRFQGPRHAAGGLKRFGARLAQRAVFRVHKARSGAKLSSEFVNGDVSTTVIGNTIRRAAASDAANLAELAARTFRDTFAEHNDPADMAAHLAKAYGARQQGLEIVDPAITTLVVETDSQLVGYAQLRRCPAPPCVTGTDPIELWRFYLAREWHGRGLAQELMRYVEREAANTGARTLWLGVWENNERAKAFYGKHGFQDVGSHVFLIGSDPQTDRLLAKALGHRAGWPGT